MVDKDPLVRILELGDPLERSLGECMIWVERDERLFIILGDETPLTAVDGFSFVRAIVAAIALSLPPAANVEDGNPTPIFDGRFLPRGGAIEIDWELGRGLDIQTVEAVLLAVMGFEGRTSPPVTDAFL